MWKDLKKLVDIGLKYESFISNIEEAKEIIADGSDTEMLEMAKIQMEEAKTHT